MLDRIGQGLGQFGNVIGKIGNLALGAVGTFFQNKQASENLALQQDQFNYQKEMNKLTMEREDNAVQRRVADMEKAGINPVLAAGSASAASHQTSAPAPQRNMDYSILMNLAQQHAEIGRTNAERKRILEDAKRIRKETDMIEPRYKLDVNRYAVDYTRMVNQAGQFQQQYDLDWYEAMNVARSLDILEKLNESKKGLLNEQQLTERLRQRGLETDEIKKAVEIYSRIYEQVRNMQTNLTQSERQGVFGGVRSAISELFRIVSDKGRLNLGIEDALFKEFEKLMER